MPEFRYYWLKLHCYHLMYYVHSWTKFHYHNTFKAFKLNLTLTFNDIGFHGQIIDFYLISAYLCYNFVLFVNGLSSYIHTRSPCLSNIIWPGLMYDWSWLVDDLYWYWITRSKWPWMSKWFPLIFLKTINHSVFKFHKMIGHD